MERKRALTSVDLAALVSELRRYGGAKLDKAYLYPDDLLRLKMRDFDRGRVELLAGVREPKRVHVADPDRVPDAPGRPPNFAMMLRNRLSGADFVDVEQFEFDRILSFHFERDDANTTIVVELFGDGNVAVLNEDREVVSSLDTVRLKSRTVAPGSQYGFPASRFNPLEATREKFGYAMDDSDTDVVRTIATQLNFGGLWGEEICTRAGVEKTTDIEEATEGDYDELYRVIDDLVTRLKEGNLDPRLYRDEEGRVVDATPVPMEEYEGLSGEPCEDFNAALDQHFFELRRLDAEESGESAEEYSDRPDFEEEIAKKERIIAQQEGAIEKFDEQAQAEREKAELLYANYDLVDEVLSTVQGAREDDVAWDDIAAKFEEGRERGIEAAEAVVGVNGSEGRVTLELDGTRIGLDPRKGVEVNADRLYKEAKRVGEKKEGALAAIEDTREELAEVKARKEQWTEQDEEPESEADEGENGGSETDWLSRSSVPVRRDEQWYERFRWFHTSDGFLVIGGRNADQNEELVKKYMDRGDLFFHTQASGAPATILKATGPSEAARDVDIPESSREEAAQFAVSYSSVWKDGAFTGDVYMVDPDQVSKTPESGEYIEKGSFVIRGDRTYYRDTPVGVAVGVQIEPLSRVVGGPPSAIEDRAETSIRIEPGRYAQNDIAKMLYREFRERFTDQTFVRKVASADRIQEFCPAGGSRIVD
jgi:predicted ribosome quality control (RQC) complex YloA/Tae2 family protein